MVTAKTQYNLSNARSYFEEHLCVGDYYEEGQRVSGEWFGKAAEKLGLSAAVRADEFLRLCDNHHPATGEKLTQRFKSPRKQGDDSVGKRRIFFDFTFSPPKSVSLAAFLGPDERIIQAHERAVRAALREYEAFAATRIRAGGADSDRLTGNVVGAIFTHETSRALDPHLHTHCIVFNATFDPHERRWKALQNREMLRARKFAENAYYHELSRELNSLGYATSNRPRGDFHVEGIPEELCARFSKRHHEIDAALEKLLRDKPELGQSNLKDLRASLATAERARKQKDWKREDLSLLWDSQLTGPERQTMTQLRADSLPRPSDSQRILVSEAVAWAEEHLFDRHSVVPEFQIWQEALSRARGGNFDIRELKALTMNRGYVRGDVTGVDVALREVLLREWEIVKTVRDGMGERMPLVHSLGTPNSQLDGEQRIALDRLLASIDSVSLFRGGAGTGKSFVLRELVGKLQEAGMTSIVLAPQRQQVLDMASVGFPSPQTVSSFLKRGELSNGAVVIVDEAGQIGGRQMLDLIRLVRESHGRLILSGDTRQHGPVEASDALVAIERHSGIRPVELRRIRRQDPARARNEAERKYITGYRSAVEAAADGDLAKSFDGLEAIGAVVACGLGEQSDRLADEYVRLAEMRASSIVVSQTWSEVHRVNSRVREMLKSNGLVGPDDTKVQILDRMDLTNAQKRDQRFYPPDAVVVFNQKVRNAQPGTKGRLAGILKSTILVEINGKFVTLSNRSLDHISVYMPREIPIAAGERLQVKANRRLSTGAKVTNGELVTVKSCLPDGRLELTDGRILDTSFREFLPGYAVTSYGSQGKTVDYVLFSDSTIKPATNAEQWYVSISRGRRGIRIFTPDKAQLRENILRSSHRKLALDLVGGSRFRLESPLWQRLEGRLLRFGRKVITNLRRVGFLRPRSQSSTTHHEHQNTRMLGH